MEHGLLPFYLNNTKEISFDPVIGEQKFLKKNKISKVDDLNKFVSKQTLPKKIKFNKPYIFPNKKLIKSFFN